MFSKIFIILLSISIGFVCCAESESCKSKNEPNSCDDSNILKIRQWWKEMEIQKPIKKCKTPRSEMLSKLFHYCCQRGQTNRAFIPSKPSHSRLIFVGGLGGGRSTQVGLALLANIRLGRKGYSGKS
jgi:hypothetical protein